ncbi:MAG: hydantoinase B/oxoprolinase family protein [Chloroflexi bacterium]|nr:hydantoinase B/oxoprolinase family protein [Chloroflexota bacterium]
MTAVETAIDPIVLEVLWNRLLSVTNEQQAALMRTAFSTIVRESQDLACGVFDTRGNMIAQSETGTPGHINSMATGMRHFLAAYPSGALEPGDVLITNDPWMTAGQINDLTVATPIFRQTEGRGDEIVAYFANTCHAADIGGRLLSAEAREVYEEGLYIPIMKLFMRGERNEELFKVIRGNVRSPNEVEGDLYAQTSCNDVGGAHLLKFMDEFGLDSIDPLADAIIARSEGALRQAIAAVPDGVYESELWSDGFEGPIVLKAKVIVDGDSLTVDHAGSSPQSRYGINSVLNYTHAYTSFAVKAAISPEVPHNEGSFRPVHVLAPEGSVLNPRHPAPVAARHIIGHFLPLLIFKALAPAMPERLMAEGAGPSWNTVFRGRRANGEPWVFTLFQCGGTGARPNKDGLNNVGFPTGLAGVPAEMIENLTSLMMTRREIRPDSGGPGRYRGGLGQITSMRSVVDDHWTMSGMYDRTKYAAEGVLGGQPGGKGDFFLSTGERPNPKTQILLDPTTEATAVLPGGGGYFSPFERHPEKVLEDVVYGYVSLEAAERDYGVKVICSRRPDERISIPEHYRIDWDATRELREAAGG